MRVIRSSDSEHDQGGSTRHQTITHRRISTSSSGSQNFNKMIIYIYKDFLAQDAQGNNVLKSHPTWRIGPKMTDGMCWMYAKHDASKLDQNLANSEMRQLEAANLDWFEYTNNQWTLVEDSTCIRHRLVNKEAKLMCNTQSSWKRQFDGVFERYETELNGKKWGYYTRTIYFSEPEAEKTAFPPNETVSGERLNRMIVISTFELVKTQ